MLIYRFIEPFVMSFVLFLNRKLILRKIFKSFLMVHMDQHMDQKVKW